MPNHQRQYAELVAKAWSDEAFAGRLRSNPHAAMKEVGIQLPPSMKVEVLESTPAKAFIVIPPKPTGELSDQSLDQISAGGNADNFCSCWW